MSLVRDLLNGSRGPSQWRPVPITKLLGVQTTITNGRSISLEISYVPYKRNNVPSVVKC